MATKRKSKSTSERLRQLQSQVNDLEETLRAIRQGDVDALVVAGPQGDRVFTLHGADHPYRVMVETINEGAATLAPDGLILYANRRLGEMVNLPLARLIGSNLHDMVKSLDCPGLDKLLKMALKVPQREECDLVAAGGKLLAVYLSLTPLQGENFQGICLTATDLTEQKRRREELADTNRLLKAEVGERRRIEHELRRAEEIFRSFMNHLPAVVFMKDEEGRYVFWNTKLKEIVGSSVDDLTGKTPLDWVPGETGSMLHERDLAALSARAPSESVDIHPTQNGESGEMLMVRFPFQDATGRQLLGGVGIDVTAQKRAEESLRRLTARLLKLQDEERRRIARDLHDSTAQILTGLALNLALLQLETETSQNPRTQSLVAESVALAERASGEIRNLSHLLHPPDLDKVGLVAAIRWHSNQMSGMTGIHITVDFPGDIERLPADTEIALFRIVQESLENIRRHSGSPVARIRLSRDEDKITLEVKDEGHGVPSGFLTSGKQNIASLGVGMAGMHERMVQLGGRLEIESGDQGTTVTATVPVPKSSREKSRAWHSVAAGLHFEPDDNESE